ncbi:DUF6577 family protein [Pontibacter mangrovi]|uniref:Uncharacterized protein n=1 Tax=Pontibacter mangrovi TaxID=2589816 RepID=A0A501VU44_9BACT|nr:DUF6577 family protein [Pontibacter mangrovi]TPE41059.1 hypothetical protein FJM65_19645 [Pontibacter mangrovi]
MKKFEKASSFTTSDISDFYLRYGDEIPQSTINWRVYHLVRKGVIQRIGRGVFKIGKGVSFEPEVSKKEASIYRQLKRDLPFLECCVWSLDAMKEFAQHIPNINLILVEVERDSTESVYHLLTEKYKHVLHKPDKEFSKTNAQEKYSAILVRPLVTEAPTQKVNKINTITIEKLLVDVFTESEFNFLKGYEMTYIFKNAFLTYTVNQSKLLRYADRKQKKEELLCFLKGCNLAAF